MKNTLRNFVIGSTLAGVLAGCQPEFDESEPVEVTYAGMEAVAGSTPPRFVQLRSKNNNVTLFALDDDTSGVFEEDEMRVQVTPNWENYNPEDVRIGFRDIGPYMNQDSLEVVYRSVLNNRK